MNQSFVSDCVVSDGIKRNWLMSALNTISNEFTFTCKTKYIFLSFCFELLFPQTLWISLFVTGLHNPTDRRGLTWLCTDVLAKLWPKVSCQNVYRISWRTQSCWTKSQYRELLSLKSSKLEIQIPRQEPKKVFRCNEKKVEKNKNTCNNIFL